MTDPRIIRDNAQQQADAIAARLEESDHYPGEEVDSAVLPLYQYIALLADHLCD